MSAIRERHVVNHQCFGCITVLSSHNQCFFVGLFFYFFAKYVETVFLMLLADFFSLESSGWSRHKELEDIL